MAAELPRSPPQSTLPAQPQEEGQGARQQPQRLQLEALVGNRVLDSLGRPGDLYRMQVRPLWGDQYRVNVLVGVDATSARVVHSYFLRVDGDGNIVASFPPITKQY